jgi:hypothetical protein
MAQEIEMAQTAVPIAQTAIWMVQKLGMEWELIGEQLLVNWKALGRRVVVRLSVLARVGDF